MFIRATDIYLNVEVGAGRLHLAGHRAAAGADDRLRAARGEPGPDFTFTFSSTEPNATFRCRLTPSTSNIFTDCTSPHTYTNLVDGEYIFEVIAVNEFGIAGELPAIWEFLVAVPPDTEIVFGPPAVTSSTSASFAFRSSEPMSTFECAIDDPTSVHRVPHAVHLPGHPRAGRSAAVARHPHDLGPGDRRRWTTSTRRPPATPGRSWKTPRPRRRIDSGPTATTSSTSATFTFSANETGVTFECALDGVAYAACASPVTLHRPGARRAHPLRPRHRRGRQRRPDAGHPHLDGRRARRRSRRETTISGGPTATASTSATFTFFANEPATFECSLDGAAFAACTSPKTYGGLALGTPHLRGPRHRRLRQRRRHAGQPDRGPSTRPRRIRRSPPSRPTRATATSPASASPGPTTPPRRRRSPSSAASTASPASLWLACVEPGLLRRPDRRPAHLRGAGGRRRRQRRPDAGDVRLDGRHDRAGDDDPVRPADLDDRHQRHLHPRPPRRARPSSARSTSQPFAACTSPVTVTDLTDGEHQFRVRAVDAAGNADATPAVHTWTVDLPPDTTIDDGPDATTASQIADLHLQRQRAGRQLRVRPRRRGLRLVQLAGPVHGPGGRVPTSSRSAPRTSPAASTRRRPSTPGRSPRRRRRRSTPGRRRRPTS